MKHALERRGRFGPKNALHVGISMMSPEIARSAALGLALSLASAPALAGELDGSTPLHDADVSATTNVPVRETEVIVGSQYFLVEGKNMPGLTLQVASGLFALELETTLMWTATAPAELDVSFVGMELGASLLLVPLRTQRFRASAGLGTDIYLPWEIHHEQRYAALSAKVALHGWLTRELGVFATGRVYPLHHDGLELGVSRSGDDATPVPEAAFLTNSKDQIRPRAHRDPMPLPRRDFRAGSRTVVLFRDSFPSS